jgi:hypothetical protein
VVVGRDLLVGSLLLVSYFMIVLLCDRSETVITLAVGSSLSSMVSNRLWDLVEFRVFIWKTEFRLELLLCSWCVMSILAGWSSPAEILGERKSSAY